MGKLRVSVFAALLSACTAVSALAQAGSLSTNMTPTAVPEPSGFVAVACGIIGLVGFVSRRRQ